MLFVIIIVLSIAACQCNQRKKALYLRGDMYLLSHGNGYNPFFFRLFLLPEIPSSAGRLLDPADVHPVVLVLVAENVGHVEVLVRR